MTRPRLLFTGAWLRDKRHQAGISTTDAQLVASISQATLSRFERGSGRLYLSDAISLCDLYGVDIADLVRMIRRELNGDFA